MEERYGTVTWDRYHKFENNELQNVGRIDACKKYGKKVVERESSGIRICVDSIYCTCLI